jgi:hypothetical protein
MSSAVLGGLTSCTPWWSESLGRSGAGRALPTSSSVIHRTMSKRGRCLPPNRVFMCTLVSQHRIHVRAAKAPHPLRPINQIANANCAADCAGGERVLPHFLRIEQVDDVLCLPRPARPAVRSFFPLALRHPGVEFIDVGKFLPRLKHTSFERLRVMPTLDDADDVDRHQLEVERQLLVVDHPAYFVREPNKLTLDDAVRRVLVVAFDRILITREASIACGGCFTTSSLILAPISLSFCRDAPAGFPLFRETAVA